MRTTAATALAAAVLAGGAALTGAAPASAAPAPTPVHFAPGATSGAFSGDLGSGGEHDYAFSAAAGQEALVDFTDHGNASLHWTLVAPDGTPLHSQRTQSQGQFTTDLPASGTYHFDVGTSGAGQYDVKLTLPVPIRFAAGGTSGSVTGSLPARGSRDYSFAARAGQQATVTLDDASSTARWVLIGPDGQPLRTEMDPVQRQATVTLPATGTYWLSVETGQEDTYRLGLGIPAR